MDVATKKDGYFKGKAAAESSPVSATRVVLKMPALPQPLSPWLRLAHEVHHPTSSSNKRAVVRWIKDFEFVLVTQGCAWMWIEALDGAIPLETNSLVLIPPDLVHAWSNSSGSHLAVHFDLCAQPNLAPLDNLVMLKRWVAYHATTIRPLVQWEDLGGRHLPLIRHLPDPQPWRKHLDAIRQISAGRSSETLMLDEQLAVQEHLNWTMRTWLTNDSADSDQTSPEQRVLAFLSELDPAQRITINELADRLHLSGTTLRQAFHEVTGMPPRTWLEQRRIQAAAHTLLNTELSITSIARQVGYPDPYHFSRVFKRLTGLSPRRYRQQQRMNVQTPE